MTPSEIRLLALSLYASARRVERLPRYAEYAAGEIVEIVKVPEHLIPTLARRTAPRYEGI